MTIRPRICSMVTGLLYFASVESIVLMHRVNGRCVTHECIQKWVRGIGDQDGHHLAHVHRGREDQGPKLLDLRVDEEPQATGWGCLASSSQTLNRHPKNGHPQKNTPALNPKSVEPS